MQLTIPKSQLQRFVTFVLASLIAIAGAEAAQAADVCLSGGSDNFIIKKVKKLKANSAIPLTGIWFAGASSAPFDGSAMMSADGMTVKAGIFVHSAAASLNYTVEWITDSTYAGVAGYDNNGDYVPNGLLNLVVVDCSTLTPP